MKTNYSLHELVLVCLIFFGNNLIGQATFDNNNIGLNRFLGFNAGQNLEFRTNNITRMQLMQSGNSLINGYTINRSGFLGLSVAPPFSLIMRLTQSCI